MWRVVGVQRLGIMWRGADRGRRGEGGHWVGIGQRTAMCSARGFVKGRHGVVWYGASRRHRRAV